MEILKNYDLNGEYFKAIWSFYEVYKICLNVLGLTDDNIKRKQKMIIAFTINSNRTNTLARLKEYLAQDSIIVEMALNNIDVTEEVTEVTHDFYPPNIFGVNIYDRE